MGELMDAPNKEVLGLDPPWVEGTGGDIAPGPEAEPDLKSLTKAELLERASARGVEADESMTKAQITEALEASEG